MTGPDPFHLRSAYCPDCKVETRQYVNTAYYDEHRRIAMSYMCLPCGLVIDITTPLTMKFRKQALS